MRGEAREDGPANGLAPPIGCPDEARDDLARQIYLVSHVATSKYRAYRLAWRAILVEVSLFVVLAFSMAVTR